MKGSWVLLVTLVVMSTGCAFTPQAVVLRPDMQVAASSVGQGRSVLVTVVDERPRSTLGTRGVRGVGAEITVEGDVLSVVRAAVSGGLQRQGFTPTQQAPADGRELRVEVRNLEYGLTQGFFSGTLRTECGLKAVCILGNSRPFEQLYRGEVQEGVAFVQGAEANEKYINTALSRALNALLEDPKLSSCPASKGQP